MLGFIGSDDFSYELLVFLHLVAVIIGFGSTFVLDLLGARAGKVKGIEGLHLSKANELITNRLTSPPIYLAGALGLVLVLIADSPGVDFDQGWVMAAITVYVLGILNAEVFLKPTAKKMIALQEELVAMGPPPGAGPGAAGPVGGPPPQVVELEALGKRMPMFGGFSHLVFVVILWIMIFKPGL